MEIKIDPYGHKERFLKWKKSPSGRFSNLTKKNQELIFKYISDMEIGVNIPMKSQKGTRSYIRLNTLRDKICFMTEMLEDMFGVKNLEKINEDEIHSFFQKMDSGEIRRRDGKVYRTIIDFMKVFKAFWHWLQVVFKKKGRKLKDVTEDLSAKRLNPEWVFLGDKKMNILINTCKYKYRVLARFLYDSGIRAPVELINLKVSDLSEGCEFLDVREEIVKKGSFGRKIELTSCREELRDYIEHEQLKGDQRLFYWVNPKSVNQYFKRISEKLFGKEKTQAGKKYSEFTLYDFRHNSACYWAEKMNTQRKVLHRFGWKKEERLNYYTGFLGISGRVTEETSLKEDSIKIRERLIVVEEEKSQLKEKMLFMSEQMKQMQQQFNLIMESTQPLQAVS